MNYEDDHEDLKETIQRDVLFALEREAHRFGFVGDVSELEHPELGLRLRIRCHTKH